jgi:hypothetical protein
MFRYGVEVGRRPLMPMSGRLMARRLMDIWVEVRIAGGTRMEVRAVLGSSDGGGHPLHGLGVGRGVVAGDDARASRRR